MLKSNRTSRNANNEKYQLTDQIRRRRTSPGSKWRAEERPQSSFLLTTSNREALISRFNVQIQKWAVAKFHAFKPPVESAAILQISSEKKFYGGPGNYGKSFHCFLMTYQSVASLLFEKVVAGIISHQIDLKRTLLGLRPWPDSVSGEDLVVCVPSAGFENLHVCGPVNRLLYFHAAFERDFCVVQRLKIALWLSGQGLIMSV